MALFVVCHGAWSASWAWKRMHPLLRARGHDLVVPCYTGLGERAHLLSRGVTLATHIEDVCGVFEIEDLDDVILLGHSYGGMVATGVAGVMRERIAKLVYLDAFVPRDGQSLFDLQPPQHAIRVRDLARRGGEGWLVPPQPLPPDTSAYDLAWITPRRFPQPIATFESPLVMARAGFDGPRTFIYCSHPGPGDVFRQFADAALREADWSVLEIAAGHNPHITVPDMLAEILDRIACGA